MTGEEPPHSAPVTSGGIAHAVIQNVLGNFASIYASSLCVSVYMCGIYSESRMDLKIHSNPLSHFHTCSMGACYVLELS